MITGVAAVGVAIAVSGLASGGARNGGGRQRVAGEVEQPEFEPAAR